MTIFESAFAEDIQNLLDYREALGFSRTSHQGKLRNFDLYCLNLCSDVSVLTQDLVLTWLNDQTTGIRQKATAIRLLGKYQVSIGKEAYILYDKYLSTAKSDSVYLFSSKELKSLFYTIDTYKKEKNEPFFSEIAPVLYRLIYTCGLRPNEGRELKRENVNFETGEILITETKFKKERFVVMSDDMLHLCCEYNKKRAVFSGDNPYFFPAWGGGALTAAKISRHFIQCFVLSNPNIERKDLPYVRVYDLRHLFASTSLNRWLDKGISLNEKLPYLRAYMGHSSLSETAYYIHLLPENLVKSAGIDWESLNAIVPEVLPWEE